MSQKIAFISLYCFAGAAIGRLLLFVMLQSFRSFFVYEQPPCSKSDINLTGGANPILSQITTSTSASSSATHETTDTTAIISSNTSHESSTLSTSCESVTTGPISSIATSPSDSISEATSWNKFNRYNEIVERRRATAGVESSWMVAPIIKTLCPSGLEYLQVLDALLVVQLVEPLEVATGFEETNRYVVLNSDGSKVYFALESSDICMRQCCGSKRGFEMSLVDNESNVVLQLSRPYRPCACYCCCACTEFFQHEIIVEAPPKTVIARVKQIPSSCLDVSLHVYDPQGKTLLCIDGPHCCSKTETFPIWNAKKTNKIGSIIKQWSALEDVFQDADTFSIHFPIDLDVQMKAALLATTLLIDYIAFEDNDDLSKL